MLTLGGIARENAMVAIAVGGVADHVHLLLSLPSHRSHRQGCSIAEIGFLEVDPREFPQSLGFSWQRGYGTLVGQHFPTGEDGGYIQAQANHHERVSSAEEFIKFLMAHAMLP